MDRNEQRLGFEERVDRYLNNKLAQDQINELWVEVIEDKRKYEYLKTAAALTGHFAAERTQEEMVSRTKPANTRSKPDFTKIRNFMAAAGIAIVIGLSSVLIYSTDSTEYITPLSTLDFALLRDAGEPYAQDESEAEIQSAISLAQRGETDLALHRLTDVYESTDASLINRSEALLAIGIIQYNTGDYPSATRTFRRIIAVYEDDVLVERSTWYLAQSLLASGDISGARVTMREVVDMGGAHSRAAERYYRYLR